MWQRDGAAGDGKTFTSGVVASPPARTQQRPGKRKLIWKRELHQVNLLDVSRSCMGLWQAGRAQGLTSEVMLQDTGDASQPQPDASSGAENGSKRSRGDSSPQNDSQANARPGTTATAEQPSQAHAASAQRTRQVNGLHRPGGAAHPQHPVSGGRHTSSEQLSHLPPAKHVPQNGAQDPAKELRQLKEKIAAREARLQRERVSTCGSFLCWKWCVEGLLSMWCSCCRS